MNYAKTAGQFVCKMAMPLALMFAACSTDNGNTISKVDPTPGTEMGGSSEEPSIIAYENVSLRGRAYYAPAESGGSLSSGNFDTSFSRDFFWTGGEVTLKELDSLTLKWTDEPSYTVQIGGSVMDSVTGMMVAGNDGVVRFDSLSLKSPIVLLIAHAGDVSLHAIFDLRDSGTFVIDAYSHLVAGRLQKLVAFGKSFAEAKSQAESEVASIFGFDDFGPSEAALLRAELNELPFRTLNQIRDNLEETESFAGLSAATQGSVKYFILPSRVMRILLLPEAVFERLGEGAVQFYQECLQKKKYLLHMLAKVYGYDACSAANEGKLADIQDDDLKLECKAGSWNVYNVRAGQMNVNHVLGTMIDSRDGQTYKTVTYNFDGVSQTWMAENLKYAAEKSSCVSIGDDSSYCTVYGRLYTLFPLDSTYDKYASEEDCYADRMKVWMDELRAVKGEVTEYDSLLLDEDAHRLCKELEEEPDNPDRVNWSKVIDSLDVLGFNVCPEGWRMPTYEDWMTLITYIDGDLLMSAYGNPAGFGMDLFGAVTERVDGYRVSLKSNENYLFTPRLTPEEMLEPGAQYVGDAIGMFYIKMSVLNDGYLKTAYMSGMPSMGYVRCVKND